MAAYRRVYDKRHLQVDCMPRTEISSGILRSVIEYGLPFPLPINEEDTSRARYKMHDRERILCLHITEGSGDQTSGLQIGPKRLVSRLRTRPRQKIILRPLWSRDVNISAKPVQCRLIEVTTRLSHAHGALPGEEVLKLWRRREHSTIRVLREALRDRDMRRDDVVKQLDHMRLSTYTIKVNRKLVYSALL